MPTSKDQTDMSCDKRTTSSTPQLSSKLVDSSCHYPSSKENVRNPISFLIDASQNHINSTAKSTHVSCEGQPLLTVTVDQPQGNKVCSSNPNQHLNTHKYLSSSTPSGKALNLKATNENNVGNNYGLNNSLRLNDGKESIELMISSLCSAENTEETKINESSIQLEKSMNCETVCEKDTPFNTVVLKPIVEFELSPEATQNALKCLKHKEPTGTTKKIVSMLSNKFKNSSTPPKSKMSNLNEMECTAENQVSELQPIPSATSSTLAAACDRGSDRQPLAVQALNIKKQITKSQDTHDQHMENSNQKILVNNKPINSYNAQRTGNTNKSTMRLNTLRQLGSIDSRNTYNSPAINSGNTVSAKNTNTIPIRNEQLHLLNISHPSRSGRVLLFTAIYISHLTEYVNQININQQSLHCVH